MSPGRRSLPRSAKRRPCSPAPPTATNIAEYTVTEIAFALKRTVEDAFGLVRVRGEMSGFKRAASGHLYFTLKDEKACLDAVAWRTSTPRLTFQPADGLEVVCTGRLTTYGALQVPARGRADRARGRRCPHGALGGAQEEARGRGAVRPRPEAALPFLPAVVGVVTSPTGAVIRDILHRLADRFPCRVLVWPVLVQGEGAAEQVAAAIRGFSGLPEAGGPVPRPDVVIVARGGGSIEDLWAFNDEAVVRAAAESVIPLISAVGHETDTTLIDHASDRRAPTPTAAAEMAVPVRRDLLLEVGDLDGRLDHAVARRLDQLGQRLEGLARGLPRPDMVLGMAAQRLDDVAARLRGPAELVRQGRTAGGPRGEARGTLARPAEARCFRPRLPRRPADPRAAREPAGAGTAAAGPGGQGLANAIAAVLERAGKALDVPARQLEALSHARVLERGYAIVRSAASGRVLPSLAAVGAETELELGFVDGELAVRRADAPARPRARGQRPDPAEQGRLL